MFFTYGLTLYMYVCVRVCVLYVTIHNEKEKVLSNSQLHNLSGLTFTGETAKDRTFFYH